MSVPSGAAGTPAMRIGLIVGRNTDVGINVAGQQDPANPETDWMYLDKWFATFSGAAQDATTIFTLDLKAKRKLQELNQAYILAITNTTASPSTYLMWARTLVMLP